MDMYFEEFNEKYAEQVLAEGAATKEQIDECMALVDENNNVTLESALVSKGVLSPIAAIIYASKVLGIDFIDLYTFDVNPEAAKLSDKETCLKYCCLPLGKLFDSNVIVTDCLLYDKAETLRTIFGEDINIKLALRSEILREIEKQYS